MLRSTCGGSTSGCITLTTANRTELRTFFVPRQVSLYIHIYKGRKGRRSNLPLLLHAGKTWETAWQKHQSCEILCWSMLYNQHTTFRLKMSGTAPQTVQQTPFPVWSRGPTQKCLVISTNIQHFAQHCVRGGRSSVYYSDEPILSQELANGHRGRALSPLQIQLRTSTPRTDVRFPTDDLDHSGQTDDGFIRMI